MNGFPIFSFPICSEYGAGSCTDIHRRPRRSLPKSKDSSVPAGTKLSPESLASWLGHCGRRKLLGTSRQFANATSVKQSDFSAANIRCPTSWSAKSLISCSASIRPHEGLPPVGPRAARLLSERRPAALSWGWRKPGCDLAVQGRRRAHQFRGAA